MLAIAGGKGGSGKTTTALGLATALDGRTLVVDLDRDMPNLHAMADVARDPTVADWVAAPGADPLAVAGRATRGRETFVLPAACADAHPDPSSLACLAEADARTLLDCPAGAGPPAVDPLRVADAALLVASPCAAALRDALKTAAMARALGTPVVGLVLTRARLASPALADPFDCPLLGAVPHRPAPVLDDPAVRAAYREIAESLKARASAACQT